MSESEVQMIYFQGLLTIVHQTPNMIKFAIRDKLFISMKRNYIYFNDLISVINEYKEKEIQLAMPEVTIIEDKYDKSKLIVITNHTKIVYNEVTLFNPVKPEELMTSESIKKVKDLEAKHKEQKKQELTFNCKHCGKINTFEII